MIWSVEILMQIGTDIEDYKCSWLVVQALERADENQKHILFVSIINFVVFISPWAPSESFMSNWQENYGKPDPECVAKVKDLYKELNLEVCLNRSLYLCSVYHHHLSKHMQTSYAGVKRIITIPTR